MRIIRSIPEPAVSRKGLVAGAAIAWIIGGVILVWRAMGVADGVASNLAWLWGVGVVLGVLKYRMAFRKVVAKNVERIQELSPHKDKICLFAFQSLESYLLVIVMVGVGIGLRYVGLSASVLIVVYAAIGIALLLGAGRYFRAARQQ